MAFKEKAPRKANIIKKGPDKPIQITSLSDTKAVTKDLVSFPVNYLNIENDLA